MREKHTSPPRGEGGSRREEGGAGERSGRGERRVAEEKKTKSKEIFGYYVI